MALSEWVEFSYDDCLKGGAITVPTIAQQGVMDFMIDVCIRSKRRGQVLFPVEEPERLEVARLPEVTRAIRLASRSSCGVRRFLAAFWRSTNTLRTAISHRGLRQCFAILSSSRARLLSTFGPQQQP